MECSSIETLEFDLPKALLLALVEKFDSMPAAPLDENSITRAPEAQGVYQLFYDGNLEYIGKTDSQAGLHARLKRHSKNILGRTNLNPSLVTFKAIRVFVFSAMDLETELIGHYKKEKKNYPMSWQNTGFGSNDPGRNRDGTAVKEKSFDFRYPVNRFISINITTQDKIKTVADLFKELKSCLPFLFRYESKDKPAKDDLMKATLPENVQLKSLDVALDLAKNALGPSWQITVLYGYVIAYKENKVYSHHQHVY